MRPQLGRDIRHRRVLPGSIRRRRHVRRHALSRERIRRCRRLVRRCWILGRRIVLLLILRLQARLDHPFRQARRQLDGRHADVLLLRSRHRVRIDARLNSLGIPARSAHIFRRRNVAGRRDPVIDDDRLHHGLFLPRVGRRSRRAGEQITRLLAHHHLAAKRCEHRKQADLELWPADRIPGNPNAVGSAQLAGAEVFAELFGGEDELPVGYPGVLFRRGIVIAVDDKLPLDGNRLVLLVIEEQSAAESTLRGHAGRVVHRRGPEGDHADRSLKQMFLGGLRSRIEQLLQSAGHRPALGRPGIRAGGQQSAHQDEQGNA